MLFCLEVPKEFIVLSHRLTFTVKSSVFLFTKNYANQEKIVFFSHLVQCHNCSLSWIV